MTPVPILLKTKNLLVVDKPAGLSVHNPEDATNLLLTLSEQLGTPEIYPVHRLDKETSGVQILALDKKTASQMSVVFQQKEVKKIYLGITRGKIPQSSGEWNSPLTDKGEGRKNPAGLPKDRVACTTLYKVLEQNAYFSLCEFDLKTGRQHQIRKHCAVAGHSLVGDPRYGDLKYNARMSQIYGDPRMLLHCHQISFLDVNVASPQPSSFEAFFKKS